jgi:AAA family ATP:ADP antiporter
MSAVTDRPTPNRGLLEKILSLFADVRRGEGGTALLLTLNVFLLLTCYYIIKPVREALILGGASAEIKAYTSAGMVVLLLFLIPAYSAFANRVNRIRLITWVTLFFIGCLIVFYALAQANTPNLGIVFFLWVGIFNVMIIAQFWSYANDIYTPAEGKRLFAIIAFGSTVGAISGAAITKPLIEPLGVNQLMLVAAGILALCIVISRIIEGRVTVARGERGRAVPEAQVLKGSGGFKLVLSSRYLLLIGLLMLVLNTVNTTGEYILGKTVSTAAEAQIAAGKAGEVPEDEFKENFIGGFYADFFTWVNLATALIQLFVVSRFLQWFGVRAALFVLPLVALGGYSMLALAPILGAIRTVKIFENSLDYSLQNTARQALFLPTSRDAKYKAKAAIDTFFWRAGDVLSAVMVFIGAQLAHHYGARRRGSASLTNTPQTRRTSQSDDRLLRR